MCFTLFSIRYSSYGIAALAAALYDVCYYCTCLLELFRQSPSVQPNAFHKSIPSNSTEETLEIVP